MLSVWYIVLLNVYAMQFILCLNWQKMISKKEDLRVARGRDALPGEYPYVLAIEAQLVRDNQTIKRSVCTCACIKPIWSLTAAHCILDMESFNALGITFFLRYNPSNKEVVVHAKVLDTIMVPNFEMSMKVNFMHNDIGILKSENIDLSSYARLSSVDYSSLYGLQIAAVGYGLTLDDHGNWNNTILLNKPLQVTDAMIVKCPFKVIPKYCLAGTCETWTPLCPGDSGGPVIHSSGIVGVNSASMFQTYRLKGWIKDYQIKASIGIITPVSPFMDWIVNVIK